MTMLTTSYDPKSGIYSYKKDGTWFFSTCPPDQVASRRVDGKWYFVELCVGGGGGGDVTKVYVDQQDNKLQANIDKCFSDSKDYADSLVADYALISYVDDQIAAIEIPEDQDLSLYAKTTDVEAGDASTLGDAKSYTDEQIASIDVTIDLDDYAKTTDVEAGDASTLGDAKSYTDEQIAGIVIPSVDGLASQEWVLDQSFITEQVVTDAVDSQAQEQSKTDGSQDTKIATLENKVDALEGTVVEAQFKADPRDDPTTGSFVLKNLSGEKTNQFTQADTIVLSSSDFNNKPVDISNLLNGDLVRLVMSPVNYATYKVKGSYERDNKITIEIEYGTSGSEDFCFDGAIYDFTHSTPFDTGSAATKQYVDSQDSVMLDAAKKYTDDSLPEVTEPDVDKSYVDSELAKKVGNSGEQVLPTDRWKIRARKTANDGNYSYLSIENDLLHLYHVADPTADAHGISRGYADSRYQIKQEPIVFKCDQYAACVSNQNAPPSGSFCGLYNTAPGSSTNANPYFGNFNADIRVHIDKLKNPEGETFAKNERYVLNGTVTIFDKNGKLYFKHAITSVGRDTHDYVTLHFASRVPAFGTGGVDDSTQYAVIVEGLINKKVDTSNLTEE